MTMKSLNILGKIDFIIKKLININISFLLIFDDARKSLTENLFYEIKDHVKNIKNYLDIGAGDGAKTYYFSQQLGLEKENVFGLDFVTFHSVDYLENRTKNINFIDLKVDDKKYPIKSNSFDMVSAFMVAHHIKNLELFFLEINRILKKVNISY